MNEKEGLNEVGLIITLGGRWCVWRGTAHLQVLIIYIMTHCTWCHTVCLSSLHNCDIRRGGGSGYVHVDVFGSGYR